MRIKVTQQHIDAGIKQASLGCPIALALKAGRGAPVTVFAHSALIGVYPNSRSYLLPRSAVRFIRAFDDGQSVKPFNFELPEGRAHAK